MRNIFLAVLACYSLQDVQNAYLGGVREGVCKKHCLAQGQEYGYNRKTKKCFCVDPQEEDDVYQPTLIIPSLHHITMTGGSRDEKDPPAQSEEKSIEPQYSSSYLYDKIFGR